MITIHKYPLEIIIRQTIQTKAGATPIAFQLQDDIPMVWCIVDTRADDAYLDLLIYGTGQEMIDVELSYIGTIQKDGNVWHLFFLI